MNTCWISVNNRGWIKSLGRTLPPRASISPYHYTMCLEMLQPNEQGL